MSPSLLVALVFGTLPFAGRADGAATLRVPGEYASIQGALDAAVAGDTILVAAGVHVLRDPLRFKGKGVWLRSEGGPGTTAIALDPQPSSPTLASLAIFDAGEGEASVMEGFTLRGGRGSTYFQVRGGGAVVCDGPVRPRFLRCAFEENRVPSMGGAVLCVRGASPAFEECTFERNAAGDGGGALAIEESEARLTRCVLTGNKAGQEGARYGTGGAIYAGQSSLDVFGCTLEGNVSIGGGNGGGGIACEVDCSLTILDSRFLGNYYGGSDQAGGGGVSFVFGGQGLIEGCHFEGNAAGGTGGGVFVTQKSSLQLFRSTFRWNAAAGGGGLGGGFEASVQASGCGFSGNLAWSNWGGGGIKLWNAPSEIAYCAFLGNASPYGGGACFYEDASRLVNCLFAANAAGFGAGIYLNASSPNLIHCTVADNSAQYDGGGIYCYDGIPVVANTVFWNNSVLQVAGSSPAGCGTLIACSLAQDPLFSSPGEYDFDRTRVLDVAGVEIRVPDYVLREGDYGIQGGSPLIDAASQSHPVEKDLLGNRRPCGAGPDIGAYERCASEFRRGDANADGLTDLSDAIVMLGVMFLGVPPRLSCQESADLDDNGERDINDPVILLNFLYLGGRRPSEPFLACGPDDTADVLTCDSFGPCGSP